MKATSRNVELFAGGLWGEPRSAFSRGSLFYDSECALCAGMARRWEKFLHARGIRPVPLATAWVDALLRERGLDPRLEVRFLRNDGKIFGGVDAILEIGGLIWWARPFCCIARAPVIKSLFRRTYAAAALRRHCGNDLCRIQRAHV